MVKKNAMTILSFPSFAIQTFFGNKENYVFAMKIKFVTVFQMFQLNNHKYKVFCDKTLLIVPIQNVQ